MIDLLGLDLEKAKGILSTEGLIYQVQNTSPPKKELEAAFPRVIKQEYIDDIYILTVCNIPDAYR
jgi:hypothetical protein